MVYFPPLWGLVFLRDALFDLWVGQARQKNKNKRIMNIRPMRLGFVMLLELAGSRWRQETA